MRFTDPAVIGAIVGVFVLLFGAHFIIKRSGATDDGGGEGAAIAEAAYFFARCLGGSSLTRKWKTVGFSAMLPT